MFLGSQLCREITNFGPARHQALDVIALKILCGPFANHLSKAQKGVAIRN
jgi:hypothetical protein